MINFATKLWSRNKPRDVRALSFSRPLVVLQSDDWGRVGVRDRDGYEELRAGGIRLGEHPYDFYTFETAADVMALRDVLRQHRDASGRPACLVMTFTLANVDFAKTEQSGFRKLHLLPLQKGLPGSWKRPGLFEAYRRGIQEDVFFPALHGLMHFCVGAAEEALAKNAERAALLRTLWKAETPYIYWRMPWIGFEYCTAEKPQAAFLGPESQADLVAQGVEQFKAFFSTQPISACAPGYRANEDTHIAWAQSGVRVAQNGSGAPCAPYVDEWGILNLHRIIDFEPSQRELPIEKYVQLAEQCFTRGVPAIISTHSLNFHSSLKDFRGPTLAALDELLSALEAKYPNLLYVNDGDLYEIVNRGRFKGPRGPVSVNVNQAERYFEARGST